VVAELRELGAEAEFLRADVRREDDVRGLVDKAVARFGRLDAAVTPPAPKASPARDRAIGRDVQRHLRDQRAPARCSA